MTRVLLLYHLVVSFLLFLLLPWCHFLIGFVQSLSSSLSGDDEYADFDDDDDALFQSRLGGKMGPSRRDTTTTNNTTPQQQQNLCPRGSSSLFRGVVKVVGLRCTTGRSEARRTAKRVSSKRDGWRKCWRWRRCTSRRVNGKQGTKGRTRR